MEATNNDRQTELKCVASDRNVTMRVSGLQGLDHSHPQWMALRKKVLLDGPWTVLCVPASVPSGMLPPLILDTDPSPVIVVYDGTPPALATGRALTVVSAQPAVEVEPSVEEEPSVEDEVQVISIVRGATVTASNAAGRKTEPGADTAHRWHKFLDAWLELSQTPRHGRLSASVLSDFAYSRGLLKATASLLNRDERTAAMEAELDAACGTVQGTHGNFLICYAGLKCGARSYRIAAV